MKRNVIVILSTLLLFSCWNSFDSGNNRLATLKVSAAFPGADGAKTVVPDFLSEIDEIEVSLTSNDGYAPPASQIITSSPWELSFSVPVGSWDISAVARRAGVQIGSGSAANVVLTAGAALPVTVSLTFVPAGAIGSVRFAFSFPDSLGIDYAHGRIDETSAEATPSLTLAGGRSSGIFEFTNLATGTYSLVLTFKRGGAGGTLAGTFREKLIVTAGYESGSWVDGDGNLVSERAFSAEEFFENNASLAGLAFDSGLLSFAFDSSTLTYSLGPIAGLPAAVTFVPTESISGQYLEYSWNSGSFTEIRSGAASGSLAVAESNQLTVRVTAPDRTIVKEYSVTFSKGYRVTYNGNGNTGGSAPVDSTVYGSGAPVTASGQGSLSRSGWGFINWNTAADGSGTPHAAGSSFPMGTEDIILYAHWGDIPSDVTNLAVVTGAGAVTLSWNDPGDADLASVLIEYDGGGPVSVGKGIGSAVVSGLVDFQLYTFTVKAVDGDGLHSPGVSISASPGTYGSGSYTLTVPGGTVAINVSGGAVTITSCSTGVTSLDIPSHIGGNPVTVLSAHSFENCTNLTHLTLPPTLLTLSAYTFIWCTSLTELVIPPSVTYIGGYAFYGTTHLISVTIPASVTEVREVPFENCYAMQAINVDPANPVCSSQDGVLFNKSGSTLLEYPGGKAGAYTIPSSTTSIYYGAFRGVPSITSVVIPSSVTSFGAYAFYTCSNLAAVHVQATTPPSLGTDAFTGNAGGRTIYVPSASVDTYKAAAGWSAYAGSIVGE